MPSLPLIPFDELKRGDRVTVFGGSGFVGRHIVRLLAQTGANIRVGVRDVDSALFLKPNGDVGQIVPWQVDISDPAQVATAVKNSNIVVNLVGILFERGQRTFQRIHVDAAPNVAQAAANAGTARFLHMSALGADEHSPAAYGRTKKAGENAVKAAFPGATIFRPSVIFGPEDEFFNKFAGMARALPVLPVMGTPFIPKFVDSGKFFSGIDFFGAGGCRFQPVYVGDVAQAMFDSIGNRSTHGEILELGGPRVYSFKELMELVLDVTGRRNFLIPIPLALASLQAFFLQFLPKPLLTPDQLALLERDNVVNDSAKGFEVFGIQPKPAEIILPSYLNRFRKSPLSNKNF